MLKKIVRKLTGKDVELQIRLIDDVANGRDWSIDGRLLAGARIDWRDRYGHTALHHAVMWNEMFCIKRLIERGAKLDVEDKYGNTPVHEAASYGYIGVLIYLANEGARLDKANKNGWLPIHCAAIRGDLKCVKYLVNNGVNRQCKRGFSVLHYAAEYGRLDVVMFLLESGADLDLLGSNGENALSVAIKNNKNDVVEFLEQRMIPWRERKVLDSLIEQGIGDGVVNGLAF